MPSGALAIGPRASYGPAPMDFREFRPEGTPEHVRDLAVACVQFVERATGVQLDFTSDTLPLLDFYLRSVGTSQPEIRGLVAPAAGAYFGELVRRAFPARWHAPESDHPAWRIEFETCFLFFNPIALALEAIDGHEAVEGGAGFGVTNEDRGHLVLALEVLGTLPEDEYYLLSTRFDVLESVVDRLMGGAEKEFPGQVRVSAAAYANVLDPPAARSN